MKKENGNVWWFFLIAIGFTWLFELPRTLDSRGIIESPALLLHLARYLPPLGPFVAAFLLTWMSSGTEGMMRLLKKGWDTKFGKIWWIPTLLLLPAMEGLAVISARLFGGEALPELVIFTQPISYATTFLGLLYLSALEEYGWRGYALDRLQKRWNALTSSLILAAFWGPFHLQQWFAGGREIPFIAFWYGICMQAIVLTWLYNNTKSSLLPVILFHALMNAQIIPTWGNMTSTMIFVIIWTLVPVIVIFVWGPRTLTRRTLAYPDAH
jgi:membrane protease YdiL (CAAX protease family)